MCFYLFLHSSKGFQNQVQQSSETAKAALQTVSHIQNQILDVENTIDDAERVMYQFIQNRTCKRIEIDLVISIKK